MRDRSWNFARLAVGALLVVGGCAGVGGGEGGELAGGGAPRAADATEAPLGAIAGASGVATPAPDGGGVAEGVAGAPGSWSTGTAGESTAAGAGSVVVTAPPGSGGVAVGSGGRGGAGPLAPPRTGDGSDSAAGGGDAGVLTGAVTAGGAAGAGAPVTRGGALGATGGEELTGGNGPAAGNPRPGAGGDGGIAGAPWRSSVAGAAGAGDAALAGAAGAGLVAAGSPSTACALLEPSAPGGGRCTVEPGATSALLLVADLVTPEAVIERGQLLVDGAGRIACVGCDCAGVDPGATRVICPDAVAAPGLVNAHDHAGWMNGEPIDQGDFVDLTGAPLEADPGTRFEHRNDWREAGNGRLPKIAAPGGGATLAEKIHGELRFALGGATTSFASARLTGLLRDVDDSALTDERTRNVDGHAYATYETFPLGASAQAASGCGAYSLRGPVGAYPWVPHVAEGIDVTARNELLCLTGLVPGGFDVLDGRTAIIHGVALLARDMAYLAAQGTKVVWSPRSNLVLYGDTARVTAMDRLGVTLGLGTDWLPTGSMNVLRELACADEFNRAHLDGYFADAELVAMATAGAAAALGYDDALGRLAVGLMGDVAVFARRGRPPHRAVIDADEGDVLLVLRGGVPTVGDAELVAALAEDCDPIGEVCGVPKRACVARDTGERWDAIVAAVGPDAYPLFGCGAPPGEVTCVPSRSLPEGAVAGPSSVYSGRSAADDLDGDGIVDAVDLCPTIFDPVRPLDEGAQADADGDGVGDACDPCPLAPARAACAGDLDGDGVGDGRDLCPFDAASSLSDRDGDGWGDACDACPDAPNPGTAACPGPPATIAELWRLGDGVTATLDGVCVVAAKPPRRLWIQDPQPASSGESAGLFVYSGDAELSGSAGDRIRVSGTTATYDGGFELTEPTVTVLAVAAPDCATEALAIAVTPESIAPGAATELDFRYRLVRLDDVAVTHSGEGSAPLVIDGVLPVSSYLAGFDPITYPVGTRFAALWGVVDYHDGSQIAPRTTADLMVE